MPEKITSSIPEPRMLFAEVSPIHHLKDSTIFDLPQPLGPTIPVKPFSIKKVVFSINDLKPVNQLIEILKNPYTQKDDIFDYQIPSNLDEKYQTFCGT